MVGPGDLVTDIILGFWQIGTNDTRVVARNFNLKGQNGVVENFYLKSKIVSISKKF